jgi:hypothetical protein
VPESGWLSCGHFDRLMMEAGRFSAEEIALKSRQKRKVTMAKTNFANVG